LARQSAAAPTAAAGAAVSHRSDETTKKDAGIIDFCAQEGLMRVARKALTFDDVLLVPAHSLVVPRDVSLATRLTRTITLNIPLLSAAMDTVTEARLAIAIAQEGGLGIVKEFQYLKAHTTRATKATCAGPLTFGSRIHPGKMYKGVVDVAERFAEVINAELKGLVAAGADFIQLDEPARIERVAHPLVHRGRDHQPLARQRARRGRRRARLRHRPATKSL
jgi:hypothetical protein